MFGQQQTGVGEKQSILPGFTTGKDKPGNFNFSELLSQAARRLWHMAPHPFNWAWAARIRKY